MKVKKYLLSFVLIVLASLLLVSGVKGEVDNKRIDVKEMSYAEVIEYEEDEIDKEFSVEASKNNQYATNSNQLDNTEKVIEEVKPEEVSILVFGSSKISLSPDIAKICASIETLNNDMSKSKEENFQTFNKVIAKLKELGVDEKDIILNHFNCYPNYDYGCGRNIIGYRSTISFCVNVKSLDKIKDYVSAMTEEGVTQICDVVYEVSNIEEEYNNALSSAVDNAKTKAEKLLSRNDLKIVSIKEEYVYSHNCLYRSYAEDYSASDMVGKVEIEAKVLVEFN